MADPCVLSSTTMYSTKIKRRERVSRSILWTCAKRYTSRSWKHQLFRGQSFYVNLETVEIACGLDAIAEGIRIARELKTLLILLNCLQCMQQMLCTFWSGLRIRYLMIVSGWGWFGIWRGTSSETKAEGWMLLETLSVHCRSWDVLSWCSFAKVNVWEQEQFCSSFWDGTLIPGTNCTDTLVGGGLSDVWRIICTERDNVMTCIHQCKGGAARFGSCRCNISPCLYVFTCTKMDVDISSSEAK